MVKQRGTEAQGRFAADCGDLRLAGAVPVFERSFKIAIKEIQRADEIIGVSVCGIETERATQIALCGAALPLFKCDSREFEWETLIAGRKLLAGEKGLARLAPALEMSESEAVVIIEVGGAAWLALQKLDEFRPALLLEELFGRR